MSSALSGVTPIVLIDADPRPSFVVLLPSASSGAPQPASVVHFNRALSSAAALFELVLANSSETHPKLWNWITGSPPPLSPHGTPTPSSMHYANVHWTRYIVLDRWVVVGANEQAPVSEVRHATSPDPSVEPNHDGGGHPKHGRPTTTSPLPTHSHPAGRSQRPSDRTRSRSTTDPGWILPDFMPDQEPFLNVINSVAWKHTPLGPMQTWPARLQQTFSQVIADSRPIAIYWGPRYTTIYNEAFSRLCGSKHPALLGRPVEDAWPEAGGRLRETMQTCGRKQRSSIEDEWRFFVEKADGSPEEIYLKWSIIPICEGPDVLGFMHPVLETTSMRLWERRMKMLIDLGEVLVTARDIKSYWGKTIEELEAVNPSYDIPLAVLYSVDNDPEPKPEANLYDCAKVCQLEGSLGVPPGHPLTPQNLALGRSDEGLSAKFREALMVQYPTLLETRDGSLPESLLRGLQWRGFGDPCHAAVICPIRPTKEENVMGLLFLGLNPRRPYDNDYRQYISLLGQKLTSSLASTVLIEEESRRGRNAAAQAAYDQAMLKEKLAYQTKEATESTQKFEAVAEFIPVGMCFGEYQGNITFANDAWYRITGYPQSGRHGTVAQRGFLSCALEEDQPKIVRAYEQLQNAKSVTFEFRVRRRANEAPAHSIKNSPSFERGLDFFDPDSYGNERHVLASAKAERAADGSIIRVLTCLTDVTLHKHTAEEAQRRAQQAENLKRMAEFATVGMYDMDLEGRLLGANKVFFEMCGLEKTKTIPHGLKPLEFGVIPEDLGHLQKNMKDLVTEGRLQTAELRFKVPWIAEDGQGNKLVAPRWILVTFMPVRNSEGALCSISGCLSDVSLQKWQLEKERERKDQAIESKRQQENFIDMTSHEMRNPLGAIIHCADAVIASLSKVQENLAQHGVAETLPLPQPPSPYSADTDSRTLVDSGIENAETIVSCAQHQKRIVDDILTMSKLDSKLLAVTPTTVDPIQIVQEALKMFEVEARRVDIDLSMTVDKSYEELGVEYLDFDPSRLKQVLINLLTNALKFTKSGPMRNVSVAISAANERPSDKTSSVQFIPRSEEPGDDRYSQPAPTDRGPPIFLLFEVKDTGQGLTEEEMKTLFQRFQQASSRTHVKYGGSGLGLFISRRLTELQHGAIGVASQPGLGSTFAFFIEAYQPSEAELAEARATAKATKNIALANAAAGPSANTHGHRPLSLNGKPGASSTGLQRSVSWAPDEEIRGVLVVEDNLINQQITRKGLMDRGFNVDVANHGVEALDKLRRTDRAVIAAPATDNGNGNGNCTNADDGGGANSIRNEADVVGADAFPLSLILMDIEMPVQDGLTCTRHIRELEARGEIRGGRIPIIAVSANARMEQMLEAKAAGCDDVLVKPYRMPELIDKMRLVVRLVKEGVHGGGGAAEGIAA